jgi:hypothetical protein
MGPSFPPRRQDRSSSSGIRGLVVVVMRKTTLIYEKCFRAYRYEGEYRGK